MDRKLDIKAQAVRELSRHALFAAKRARIARHQAMTAAPIGPGVDVEGHGSIPGAAVNIMEIRAIIVQPNFNAIVHHDELTP